MTLPKIDLPLYEITVPSTGKKTVYRPFTVKEEKILLLAKESKDTDQIILAISQIINNCVKDVDTSKLATFDMEFLMLNIRAKSVNEVIKFRIADPDTGDDVELELNVNNIAVTKTKEHSNVIKLNDSFSLVMRYPTINELKFLSGEGDDASKIFNMMVACIDSIVEGDSVSKMSDFSKQEVLDFVEELPTTAVADIQNFFKTMPVMRIECPYKNKKGESKTFVIQGVESFFI